MPFKSRKQEKWMWANKPSMAKQWADKYGSLLEAYSRKKKRRKKGKK